MERAHLYLLSDVDAHDRCPDIILRGKNAMAYYLPVLEALGYSVAVYNI